MELKSTLRVFNQEEVSAGRGVVKGQTLKRLAGNAQYPTEKVMVGLATQAPFSLLLRGAPTPIVPEGMHRLTFADGASFELYLIPIHTPARGQQDYQIVFN